MDPTVSKVIVLLLFWIITSLAAFLPWLMKVIAGGDNPDRKSRVVVLLSALNYIAGGVFIATILLHLVPEVHDSMHHALIDYGAKTEYPVPELVIGLGLLLFVLIEQVVLVCHGSNTSDDSETQHLTATNNKDGGNVDGATVDGSHDHSHGGNLLQTTSMIRSYALLIALSLHSIFEGMVVGFQERSVLVWELFVAIIIHKILVAFGLGSRLLTSRHSLSIWHYVGMIMTFSTMTPLGGVIGTIMSQQQNSSPVMVLVESVLVGLATGSFMFVTFFEIIRFEGGNKANLGMSLLVVLGFGCMAAVISLHPEHEHEH